MTEKSPTPRARVILVDDHPVVREGLSHLLEQQAGVDDGKDYEKIRHNATMTLNWPFGE